MVVCKELHLFILPSILLLDFFCLQQTMEIVTSERTFTTSIRARREMAANMEQQPQNRQENILICMFSLGKLSSQVIPLIVTITVVHHLLATTPGLSPSPDICADAEVAESLSSHRSPVKPELHRHSKDPTRFTHSPLMQGEHSHSSMSDSQLLPVKPVGQSHTLQSVLCVPPF